MRGRPTALPVYRLPTPWPRGCCPVCRGPRARPPTHCRPSGHCSVPRRHLGLGSASRLLPVPQDVEHHSIWVMTPLMVPTCHPREPGRPPGGLFPRADLSLVRDLTAHWGPLASHDTALPQALDTLTLCPWLCWGHVGS